MSEKNEVIEAILEKIKEREAELYRQKQKAISEIFERAEKEDWLSAISKTVYGKRFLFELAVRSCEASLMRLLPEKKEHAFSGDPLIMEIRKFLIENTEKDEK